MYMKVNKKPQIVIEMKSFDGIFTPFIVFVAFFPLLIIGTALAFNYPDDGQLCYLKNAFEEGVFFINKTMSNRFLSYYINEFFPF